MRILFTLGALAGLVANCPAAGSVAVYVDSNNAPSEVVERAKQISGRMFSSAGVTVEWRSGRRESGGGIVIEFEHNTASRNRPGAMAYARAYEGVHIVVLYDRIVSRTLVNSQHRASVLAHVMTHEITHVIQRIERHSASGIMKARWDSNDYISMTFAPLSFTAADIDLIHMGLQRSEATSPML
jgi:hypothetical protein